MSSNLRGIDRARVNAQLDLLNRVTRNGELDLDLALREQIGRAHV